MTLVIPCNPTQKKMTPPIQLPPTPQHTRRENPVKSVLREADGETYRELVRQVEYCEITWPQCYVMGESIHLTTTQPPGDSSHEPPIPSA